MVQIGVKIMPVTTSNVIQYSDTEWSKFPCAEMKEHFNSITIYFQSITNHTLLYSDKRF